MLNIGISIDFDYVEVDDFRGAIYEALCAFEKCIENYYDSTTEERNERVDWFINSFRKLKFPGFDHKFTWADGVRDGRSRHSGRYHGSVYLDGPLGIILYYRGVHAITIGFGIRENNIYIAQVQLAKKKNNRFLFKIGCHLEYIIERFSEVFDNIYLVEGHSAVQGIFDQYKYIPKDDCYIHSNHECEIDDCEECDDDFYKSIYKSCGMSHERPFSKETEKRIIDFYNKDLKGFVRTDDEFYSGYDCDDSDSSSGARYFTKLGRKI